MKTNDELEKEIAELRAEVAALTVAARKIAVQPIYSNYFETPFPSDTPPAEITHRVGCRATTY
jgi:hypothetical protein